MSFIKRFKSHKVLRFYPRTTLVSETLHIWTSTEPEPEPDPDPEPGSDQDQKHVARIRTAWHGFLIKTVGPILSRTSPGTVYPPRQAFWCGTCYMIKLNECRYPPLDAMVTVGPGAEQHGEWSTVSKGTAVQEIPSLGERKKESQANRNRWIGLRLQWESIQHLSVPPLHSLKALKTELTLT